ncbi:MAG TPA: hypothetical protein VNG12_07005 [Acidimicrobiales bacterium]|nr:hypothetical protein [Acidimicrobiales bacterium]
MTQSDAPTLWGLEGSHFFARYALTFRVTPLNDQRCQVSAESSGSFPGIHGAAYRALVIGTGGHVVSVRGMLRQIKADAERPRTVHAP